MLRLLSILLVTATLATAAWAVSGTQAASTGSDRGYSTVKFVLDYRGTVNATWRNWSPVIGGITCRGHDSSGTFTSTIRPGSRPYTLLLYKDLGGRRLETDWRPNNPKGLVSANRTAQGWMMRRSAGQCNQAQRAESGCGPQDFTGPVYLDSLTGSTSKKKRFALHWLGEQERLDCSDGITYDHRIGTIFGQRVVTVLVKNLYRCGIRKGRRCNMTIGGTTDYPFQVTQQETTYTSNVHTEWSVRFRVVSRR